jgi:hypothetical protein
MLKCNNNLIPHPSTQHGVLHAELQKLNSVAYSFTMVQ